MSESKGKLVASIKQQGKHFNAHYEGNEATFDTFDEASQFIVDQEEQATETPEKPADELTIEEAEAINGNVNTPPTYPDSGS